MKAGFECQIFDAFPEIRVFFRITDDQKALAANRDIEQLRHQLHGDKVFYVNKISHSLSGDGLYTDMANLPLGVRSADCLPILFYNKTAGTVGAVHAGWRGTEKEIIKKAVLAINDKFGTGVQDSVFYFGPAAQKCCYDKDFVNDNIDQLKSLGVDDEQIENSGICTIHNSEYPSHRREKEKRAETILSIIGLT